jgi:hypothetical protein
MILNPHFSSGVRFKRAALTFLSLNLLLRLDVLLHKIIHIFLQLPLLCPQSIILEAGDDSGNK